VLPAVGYGAAQLEALRQTLNASDADVIVSATPVDLARLLPLDKTVVRARYEFAETGEHPLALIIGTFMERVVG